MVAGNNETVELNDTQIQRIDEIYNAALDFCKVLTENEDLQWDMYFIGEIADFAAEFLAGMGMKVRFPAIITEEDGKQYIEEFYPAED